MQLQEGRAPGAESSNQLKARLSKALFELNLKLATCKSGALVQVWMPEVTADGSMVLSAQGLPFAIAGVGDLLALFRCVSCRYRFSTDVTRPAVMGAIGRVYSSCEPEMSHNVQKYDKQVYLRVSEAQRCRVHSTLVMPVFDSGDGEVGARPIAVFELVQADKDVPFPAVIAELRKCLTEVSMFTSEPDHIATNVGLRNWPMHIDSNALLRELGGELRSASSLSNSAGRLLLENDVPDDEGPTGPAGPAAAAAEAAAATGMLGSVSGFLSPVANAAAAAAAGPASSSVSARQLQSGASGCPAAAAATAGSPFAAAAGVAGQVAVKAEADADMTAAADGSGQGSAPIADDAAAAAAAVGGGAAMAVDSAAVAAAPMAAAAADDVNDEAQSKQSHPMQQQQQHSVFTQKQELQQKDSGSPAFTTEILNALTTAATSIQNQAQQQQQVQPQQQQLTLDLSTLLGNSMQALLQQHAQAMQGLQQQQQQQQQQQAGLPVGSPDPGALSSAISTLIAAANAQTATAGNSAGAIAASQPLLLAVQQLQLLQQQLGGSSSSSGAQDAMGSFPGVQLPTMAANSQQQQQQQQYMQQQLPPAGSMHSQQQLLLQQQQQQQQFMMQMGQQQQGGMRRSGSSATNMSKQVAAATADDGGSDDELLGSDDDDNDGGYNRSGRGGSYPGGSNANRAMGAGRRLTFEDLQAQFGLGLKEAAANLGICATTLKRACRRNGITRWPRRQIQKLNRTLNQMGQQGTQGAPIDELVHSAIRKNLKPNVLTPAVTASLQQHLLSQSGNSGNADNGGSSAVPIPRVGSQNVMRGGSFPNSGSFTGVGGLGGSLGDVQNPGGLAMTSGSTVGLNNGGLGTFAGFSFPGTDSTVGLGLGGTFSDQQQYQQMQQLQQQQQLQQHGVGGIQHGSSSGSTQMLLASMMPQQDFQQQQLQQQIMQSQSMLGQTSNLQHLMMQSQQQQQDDGLGALMAMQQQQQHQNGLILAGNGPASGSFGQLQQLQQQQQLLMQQQHQQMLGGNSSVGLMMPPAFKNTAAAAAGDGSSKMYSSGLKNSSSLDNADTGLTQQQQFFAAVGLNAPAGSSPDTAAAAAAGHGSSPGAGSVSKDTTSCGAAAVRIDASATGAAQLQRQQQRGLPVMSAGAAAAGLQGLGDLDGTAGDAFFDLLDDDMLLDEGNLDLGALAAFEQQQQHKGVGGGVGGAAAAGGASDYDPLREFKGFNF